MKVVAITRVVKRGREAEFERKLTEFFREALAADGKYGAALLRPAEETSPNTYGIVRAFEDEAARDRFYASELFRRWDREVADLVEEPAQRRTLHGMEPFFREQSASPPPAWKMALLTWAAVNPAVYVSSSLFRALDLSVHSLVELIVINALVVAMLTWVLMPLFTRMASRWLGGPKRS